MRIIKDGNPEPKIFNCKNCGCEFEATRMEYEPEINSNAVISECVYLKICCKCPCCGEYVKRSYDDYFER